MELTVIGQPSDQRGAPSPTSPAGYVLTLADGRSVLVGAGQGVVAGLAGTGVDLAGLEAVLLVGTDAAHSCNLPSLVHAAYAAGRNRPLTVVGPTAGERHQGAFALSERLFGHDGAWGHLGSLPGFGVDARESSSDLGRAGPRLEVQLPGLRIGAVAVPRASAPGLAYRVDADGTSMTICADVAWYWPPLADLAAGTDLLVLDVGLTASGQPAERQHVSPRDAGQLASASRAGSLLLARSVNDASDVRAMTERDVRTTFAGEIRWAHPRQRLTLVDPGPPADGGRGDEPRRAIAI